MIMLIIMHCSRTIPVDFVITGLSEQDHFWHPVKVVIWLLSELEHRLKPTLLRWQQRIVIYFWIAFLRNIMPRTPPLGQGKKWSHRKITTSEIYCTKILLFHACFLKAAVHECQHELNSTGHWEKTQKVINDNYYCFGVFIENFSHKLHISDCSVNTQASLPGISTQASTTSP